MKNDILKQRLAKLRSLLKYDNNSTVFEPQMSVRMRVAEKKAQAEDATKVAVRLGPKMEIPKSAINEKLKKLKKLNLYIKSKLTKTEKLGSWHPSGWINPAGKFYDIGDTMHHSWAAARGGTDSMGVNRLYSKGWISVGHAGGSNMKGDKKFLENLSHPATKASRKLAESNPASHIEIDTESEFHTVTTSHWIKHGTIPKKGGVAEFHKNDDIKKYVPSYTHEGSEKFHGWISPEGKYHQLHHLDDHHNWIYWHTGLQPGDAQSKGWLSVGHAGDKNIQGYSKYLKDPSHPATRMARKLAYNNFDLPDDEIEVHYSDSSHYSAYPQGERLPGHKFDRVNVRHWSKYGTIPVKGSVAEFHKTDELRKEMYETNLKQKEEIRPFHGVISPKGEFHQMKDDETHSHVLTQKSKRHWVDALKEGWIIAGTSGIHAVYGHSKVLHDSSHPATKKLASMVRERPEHVQDINVGVYDISNVADNYYNVPRHLAEKGSFKKPSKMQEFHKADELRKEMWSTTRDQAKKMRDLHGVITLDGKWHPLHELEVHRGWLQDRGLQDHEAVSVGIGGQYSVYGPKILSDSSHPATKTLARKIKEHKGEFEHLEVNAIDHVGYRGSWRVPRNLAEKGNFNRPSVVAEFHKTDELRKEMWLKGPESRNALRGWHGVISPTGKFHSLKPDEMHGKPIYKSIEEKLNILKGAMRRLAPFKPQRESDRPSETEEETILDWQREDTGEGEDHFSPRRLRESITPMSGAIRQRALHHLHGATKVRRASDGKREFLLHRGMSESEHNKKVEGKGIINHPIRSSWTPHREWASQFANIAGKEGHGGKIASAWVHEDKIVHVPKQLGQLAEYGTEKPPQGSNPLSHEYEVIVEAGHNSKIHKSEFNKSDYDWRSGMKPHGDYYLEHHEDNDGTHDVYAYDNKYNVVGYAQFTHHLVPNKEETHLESHPIKMKAWDVAIHHLHRRKGLATAMYRYAEEKSGKKIIPGDFQTPEGKEFREAYDKKIEKVDFEARERGEKPKAHGWISPEGKYHEMPVTGNHERFFDRNPKFGLVNPYDAHAGGWLSIGHGGHSNVQGHSKYLKDPFHPATRTAMGLAREHFNPNKIIHLHYSDEHGYSGLPDSGYSKTDTVSHEYWTKHGTVPKEGSVAMYRSMETLVKYVLDEADNDYGIIEDYPELKGKIQHHAHGWISPAGKYHHMKPDEDHQDWIKHHTGEYSDNAFKQDWLSIGHGGAHNVQGHSTVLNNPNHPATKTARKLASKHFGEKTGILRVDKYEGYEPRPWEVKDTSYKEVSTKSFVAGTHAKPQSQIAQWRAGIFNKSIKERLELLKSIVRLGPAKQKSIQEKLSQLKILRDQKAKRQNIQKTESKTKEQDFGYSTHGSWSPVKELRNTEVEERGNIFPVPKHMDNTHEGIWVTHKPLHSVAYNFSPEYHSNFLAEKPPMKKPSPTISDEEHKEVLNAFKNPTEHTQKVDVRGAKIVHEDPDGGYLYVRPRKLKKSDDLRKEMWAKDPKEVEKALPFHGLISPEGEWHQLQPSDMHAFKLAEHAGSPVTNKAEYAKAHTIEKEMHAKGWLSVGVAGQAAVVGHPNVLHNSSHPATKELTRRVKYFLSHKDDSIHVALSSATNDDEPVYRVPRHLAEKGSFKKPSTIADYHYFDKSEDDLQKMALVFDHKRDKKPHTTVWRMEDEKGYGPYHHPKVTTTDWVNLKGALKRQPAPYEDKGFTPEERSSSGKMISTPKELKYEHKALFHGKKFGFASKEQADKWFTPDEHKELGKLGFELKPKKAKRVWAGEKQVFFEPHEEDIKKSFSDSNRGWLSPVGKFHPTKDEEGHHDHIKRLTGVDETSAMKAGWVSINRADEQNIAVHSSHLNNPATVANTQKFIKDKFDGDEFDIYEHDTNKVHSVPINHWLKHGTIPKKGGVAEWHKSIQEKLEALRGGILKLEQRKPCLYIIRHGKTAYNSEDKQAEKLRGWSDVPLDTTGNGEARALAERLKGLGIGVVTGSDLVRATETAAIVAPIIGASTSPSHLDFRPWNLGDFQGQKVMDIEERMRYYKEHPDEVVPNGESYSVFQNRYLIALYRLLDYVKISGVCFAVVTHYRNLKVSLEHWLGADEAKKEDSTCAVLKLEWNGTEWKMSRL